ncbi:fimbria/pilus outer membrane usher protein [Serratia ureilytica]|uniref:fimbria/pilus outer membrane usher protein n=1 Tax=Serratia ureilytica TaxID=300181 RepID=UPI0033759C13
MKLLRRSAVASGLLFAGVPCLASDELWFPPELVSDSGEIADLSHFNRGGQLPGTYRVQIYLNQELMEERELAFIAADTEEKRAGITDKTGLMASLSRNDFLAAGVIPQAFGDTLADKTSADVPLSPGSIIPQATTHFNFQQMRLDISIPQKWVKKRPRDWVSPELWDDGITAGLLNWSFNGTRNDGRYGSSDSYYLRLNSGFNTGPWRLRNELTLTENRSSFSRSREWQRGRTWLERGITPWRSQLVVGDTTTEGDIFESVAMRGVNLMTSEAMSPDRERGYAPVIRGVARSNARVSIRQNNYLVYETNVAPGEFAIDDLSPMYSSGDMQVTVTEADGSVSTFTVPYATLPVLLREGKTHYALSAGKLNATGQQNGKTPLMAQGTLAWGLQGGITAYGGLQGAGDYRAAVLGAGVNMGLWGAFSADVTHADSMLADRSRHSGQSLRFLYSRGFVSTGTTFQLAGYRYSTRGFYTLEESQRTRMSGWQSEQQRDASGKLIPRRASDWYDLRTGRRENMQLNIGQQLGDYGSLYLSGSRQTYWDQSGVSSSLQGGYSNLLGPVSYSLGYSESKSPYFGNTDRAINLSLSVPLDRLFSGAGKSMHASFSTVSTNSGVTQQSTLSGSALARKNLNWSVSQGHSRSGGNNSSLNLGYSGGYGDVSAGYSQGRDYRQISASASGGVIVHRGGITAGQSPGDTAVLVATPGAPGVPLDGGNGVKTDGRGYAIVPYASEYQRTRVAVDTHHLNARTEVENPVVQVVPTRGAIVRAEFAATQGLRVLITLYRDRRPLAFGTTVSAGKSHGIVGDDGQVYLTGLSERGTLSAQWGKDAGQSCRAEWKITPADVRGPLASITAECK